MTALLLVSLALLLAAGAGTAIVMSRTGETRVVLLTGVIALLAIGHGVSLVRLGGHPLGFDLLTAGAVAGLAASALTLLAVIALGRILGELDRAESLHWESMESVRGLTELAHAGSDADEKLQLLLDVGCDRLGLEIGLVSRVSGERYEVVAIHAPPDFPIHAGAVLPLEETWCRPALVSERTVALRTAELDEPPVLDFEAYLGAAIRVGGSTFGTLAFASREPRSEPFTATHKDLVLLMAQWVGSELERRDLAVARTRAEQRAEERAAAPPRPSRNTPAPGADLGATVEKLARRIARTVPAGVEVVIERADDAALARPLRLPLDAVVLSLVRHAASGLAAGSKLSLSVANHVQEIGEPGVLPAVAPARYVTLAVHETSGGMDADALTRAFDADVAEVGVPERDGGLPLAVLYRMLQRVGGDLSVEVESGRGSTFTLFLPRAEGPRPRPRRRASRSSPPPPPHPAPPSAR